MTLLLGTDYAYAIADLSVGKPLWGALFTTMPTLMDPLAAEVAGGGYARPSAVMERQGRRLVNSNTWIFPGVPAGQLVAVGIFDEAVNGLLWLATSFPPISTPGGKSVIYEPGEVAFAL